MPVRRAIAAFLLIAVSGCASAADATGPNRTPSRPSAAVSMAPRGTYPSWWAATERCSGRRGDMREVEFFVVPGTSTFVVDGTEMVAYRLQTGNRIEIFVAEQYLEHEMVVRHEMLHALLRQPGHPEEYFVTRCGLTWESWYGTQG